MIRQEKKHYASIESKSALEVDKFLNALMEAVKGEANVQRFFAEGKHCAYVDYIEYIVTPENAKDRFELAGEKYFCGECPYFHLNPDRRVKRAICDLGQRGCYYERGACEEFYERLERGELYEESEEESPEE